jgi:Immunoglobulin-like domain of bacterial spore germination
MKFRPALLALAALAASGCGSKGSSGTTTSTAPSSTRAETVSPAPMPLTVFRVRRGILHPTIVQVPRTRAVAAAALRALGSPASVTIAAGTATVELASATEAQEAEIVFTLTQFPTVKRVDVAGRTGLTRRDFQRYLPPILVESPPAGAKVTPTFRVSGTASVFEATLVVQLVRDGKVMARKTVTASEGAPGRGPFVSTFHATPGPLTVQAFAPSAVDGSPQHEVAVSVTVMP